MKEGPRGLAPEPSKDSERGPGVLRTAGTWSVVQHVRFRAASCLEEHFAQISGFSERSSTIQKRNRCRMQEFW